MAKFNRIAIIGVGLIGGSIGLAIKKRKIAGQVIGVFRRSSTMKRALRRGAVDKGVLGIREGVKNADLVILATHVHSIPKLAAEAAMHAKRGAVITDAGSTKEWIVENVERIVRHFPSVFFVGSHPMAGSEHTGVEFAKDDLLKGSVCIVTKTPGTDKAALARVVSFWRSLGANVKIMTPHEHDRTVSLVSHLPHIVAFSLAGAVPEKDMSCAAEGFKDTTRVASSDPDLWADIFLTNRKAVAKAGRSFETYFRKVLKAISKGDRHRTVNALAHAKSKHDRSIYGK